MKACILILLLSVFFISVMYIELDHDIATLLNERVKNAVNRATHDASLQLEPETLSSGYQYFDQTAALSAFKTSLANNLGLNPLTLNPLSNSIFSSKPKIEFIDFLDDHDPITFPYLYQNSNYQITKIINGPAVIAVISIEKPVFSSLSAKFHYRKWAVYEYPYSRYALTGP